MNRKKLLVVTAVLAVLGLCACSGAGNTSKSEYPVTDYDIGQSDGADWDTGDTESGSDSQDGSKWLPDPCYNIGAQGEFYRTDTLDNGVLYTSYTYDVDITYDQMNSFVKGYTEILTDMGYSDSDDPDDDFEWYKIYDPGNGAAAEMGVALIDGAESINSGGTGTWRIVLMVPENLDFTLTQGKLGLLYQEEDSHSSDEEEIEIEDEPEEKRVCGWCDGSGECDECGGTGEADYGDGYEKCPLCDGSGICNLCDGNGYY